MEVVANPQRFQHEEQAANVRLIGHTDLNGHGDSCQIVVKGNYAFVAHMETMGTSVVDISDVANPRVVAQIENPPNIHSHKVQLVGDVMLVNQERLQRDAEAEGGVRVYDVSNPEKPRPLSFYAVKGKGVHRMWFTDGKYAHISATDAGYEGPFYVVLDVSDPENPREVSRWWLPGQWKAGDERPVWRPGQWCFMHQANPVGDRAYLGYWDAGMVILDISDIENPKFISRLCWCPPYGGNTHTALPLVDRGLCVVTDEALTDNCQEGQKLVWVVDVREETNPVPIATFPVPPGDFCKKGGRFGPHNLHENRPGSTIDTKLMYLTYFNAGLRVVDTSNPYRPEEVGYYVPATPAGQAAIQLNDVYVDSRGLIFVTDRFNGGLYILEYFGPRPS